MQNMINMFKMEYVNRRIRTYTDKDYVSIRQYKLKGFQMGNVQGIYPWVGTLVMGNLMGRRFWVGRGCFFLGGTGGEEKASGHSHQGRSMDDTRFQTVPFCYIIC
jgi:hypothetical protein